MLELPELATTSLSKVLPTQVESPFKLDTEDDGRLTKQSVRQHFVLRILNGVLIMPPLGIIAFHFIPHQCNLFSPHNTVMIIISGEETLFESGSHGEGSCQQESTSKRQSRLNNLSYKIRTKNCTLRYGF